MPGEWIRLPRGCRTCLWPGSPFGSGSKQTGHLRGKTVCRWCRIGIRLPLPGFPSEGFFRNADYVEYLLWFDSVIVVVGAPKLKGNDFFLADRSSAVDVMLA